MKSLSDIAKDLMKDQYFDSLAHALLDFNNQKFESFCILCREEGPIHVWEQSNPVYFDLASLTKPMTLAAVWHHNSKFFSEREYWLLNHRGGLPAWGKLSRSNWKEKLCCFEITLSKVLYSDYSALRLMLELEKKSGKRLKQLCDFYWAKEFCHWKDLPLGAICPATGYRGGRLIEGEVNDSNAWNLKEFCSHAGLFSTVEGLAESLISLDRETGFVEQMKDAFHSFDRTLRFLNGWDTLGEENSLAGEGCGGKTFGHLGFTGTSVWIDSEKRTGQILLTNGCYPWQYAKKGLNYLRKELGKEGWVRLG